MKNILITGISSGIGYTLTQEYLNRGYTIFAIGQNCPKEFQTKNLHFLKCNIENVSELEISLPNFISNQIFEIVILNAGIHGGINTLKNTTLESINQVMSINVWANKVIIDAITTFADAKQVIAMSSGAAVNGSKGWGSYSLSKSAINMLLNVYSKELLQTHFIALAPGVINTLMVQNILTKQYQDNFPSIERLKNGPIKTPTQAAIDLINTFPKLLNYESGSFIDIRNMT